MMCVSGGGHDLEQRQPHDRSSSTRRSASRAALEISYNDKLTQLTLGNVQSITARHDHPEQQRADLVHDAGEAASSCTAACSIDSNPLLATLPTEMVTSPGPDDRDQPHDHEQRQAHRARRVHEAAAASTASSTSRTTPTLDYCQAQEIGCCVGHNGTASISTRQQVTTPAAPASVVLGRQRQPLPLRPKRTEVRGANPSCATSPSPSSPSPRLAHRRRRQTAQGRGRRLRRPPAQRSPIPAAAA